MPETIVKGYPYGENNGTFLRHDGTWATPSGGGGSSASLNTTNNTSQSPNANESLSSGTVNLHKVSKTGLLSDMFDTSITSPSTGDVLIYNSQSSKWENSDLKDSNDNISFINTNNDISITSDPDSDSYIENWIVDGVTQYVIDCSEDFGDKFPYINIGSFFKNNQKLTIFCRNFTYFGGMYKLPVWNFIEMSEDVIDRDFFLEAIDYSTRTYNQIHDKSELSVILSAMDFFKLEIYKSEIFNMDTNDISFPYQIHSDSDLQIPLYSINIF